MVAANENGNLKTTRSLLENSMFEDAKAFDPARDSKVPLARSPLALVLRAGWLLGSLLFSKHPEDCCTWLRSMIARRRPLTFPIPWLTFDAIRAISAAVGPDCRIFEYGSGHSTLYWRKLAATVVTVEHNEDWYNHLRLALGTGQENITAVLATQEGPYVNAIRNYAPAYFDIVLVDGAYRRDCVSAAIAHVKPGGLLVVDNTDWHWFREVPIAGIPDDWSRTVYAGFAPMLGHKTETSIWRKPKSSLANV